LTLTCGGAMRGYWEMASRGMHMAPASTMRIEQTLAKIGRRMKNSTNMGSELP
jgi:hypothetical protein